jgi:hypothetical protein
MLRDGVDRGCPTWVGVLQMSEQWGIYPGDLMDKEDSLMWAARWAFYRKQARWVDEERNKK